MLATRLHFVDLVDVSIHQAGVGIAGAILTYSLLKVVYNIYFSPLSKFPGPKFAAASNLWHAFKVTRGDFHKTAQKLHKQYGSVVRIAPNELSFATASSLKTIHSPAAPNRPFLKSPSYSGGSGFKALSIVSTADPIRHGTLRKLLAHAFSSKALREQEELVRENVEKFIDQVGKFSEIAGEKGLDVSQWYNFLTFDVIGDLAFGEGFGATENAAPHFWISTILDSIAVSIYFDIARRLGLKFIFNMMPKVFSGKARVSARDRHVKYTNDQVSKRLHSDTDRKDFLSNILDKKDSHGVSEDEIASNSSTLVIAGSETTSTFLTGVTYHILKNPEIYSLLKSEIRERFSDQSEITGDLLGSLPYLNATIEEGLRIFPPVPFALPRVSPGAKVDGKWIPKGTEVSVHQYTITRDPAYFSNPLKFDPSRWLTTDKAELAKMKEANQPFLLGPRVCLGRNLAYLEMRLALARLVFEYDMSFGKGAETVDWDRDCEVWTLWRKPELRVVFSSRF